MTKSFVVAVLILIAWKCALANWIVVAPFVYYDSDPPPTTIHETRYFTPISSPIWRPPVPSDYDESARSWSHFTFFYSGGAGGPTEEPYLRLNWLRMAAEFAGMLILVSLGILTAHHIKRKKEGDQDADGDAEEFV